MWVSVPARLIALAVLVVAATGAAAIYCSAATKRYEAQAELLVAPVPAKDTTLLGFSVLRESGDPRRVVETAARLVRTPEVAEAVQLQLGLRGSRRAMLDSVRTHSIGSSNLVAVVGKARTPPRSAQIANAFAAELVAERTVRFQSEVAQAVAQLQRRLARPGPSSVESLALARRLAILRGLVGARDPTLQVASNAVAPSSAAWPNAWPLIGLAALAAFLIGGALLFVFPLLRPREARVAPGARPGPAGVRGPEPPSPPAPPIPPTSEPEPASEPVAPSPPEASPGRWRVDQLQGLVDEHGHEFPHRLDEWTSYLFFLREHAGLDGRLPSEFDWLVEETFQDLLARESRS